MWGRPASVAFLPDGGLLVADDTGNTVWKVSPADPTETSATGGGATEPVETSAPPTDTAPADDAEQ